MSDRTEREIELTGVIADLQSALSRITGNPDLTEEMQKRLGGFVEDAIKEGNGWLQEEMDQRIADSGVRPERVPVPSWAGSVA